MEKTASEPATFYFYQREAQAVAIARNGGVRWVGAQGKIWFTSVFYDPASQALRDLALPEPQPDGYFEIPRERLKDVVGPGEVAPLFDEPGGGVEYWTTHEIDLEGLRWHPFR